MSIIVLLGLCAIVIDVSWYWANTLRLQRAADAAALAGAVQLPGNVAQGVQLAVDEAARNGYTQTVGNNCISGSTPYICAVQDTNPHQMDVAMTAPVRTFFMGIFGIKTINASVTANAQFTLPVPMGSPDQYFGDFGPVRNESAFAGPSVAGSNGTGSSDQWTSSPNGAWSRAADLATGSDGQFAMSTSSGKVEWLGTFGFNNLPSSASIVGIKVGLQALGSSNSGCSIKVDMSWNGGTSWTTGGGSGVKTQNLTTTETAYSLGNDTDLWGRGSWSISNLADGSFIVRLTSGLSGGCSSVKADQLKVTVLYTYTHNLTGPGSACPGSVANCFGDSSGQTLQPRGFWGTMLSQGADPVNGDAYMPIGSSTRLGGNPQNSATYYDYAIWVPPGSSGVQVYIYDPGFCATNSGGQTGTADRWFSGSTAVSSYYDLYQVNTPYLLTQDTFITGSGTMFQDMDTSDAAMGESSGATSCQQDGTVYSDGRDYHDRWWQIPLGGTAYAGGLTGAPVTGTTYRLRTTTDPRYQAATSTIGSSSDPINQANADGENSFAIYASSGALGTPQVYGLGAMEMITPLPGGANSRFFLAQIDANSGAGKTMEIKLWDPGDTGQLSATMNILQPCTTGCTIGVADPNPGTSDTWWYRYANVSSLKAVMGVSDGNTQCPNYASSASHNASLGLGFPTSPGGGGTGYYNGCWVTIDIPIDATYTAPNSGWWMIEYDMSGSSSQSAFDVTTWQVNVVGNPVHLVVP